MIFSCVRCPLTFFQCTYTLIVTGISCNLIFIHCCLCSHDQTYEHCTGTLRCSIQPLCFMLPKTSEGLTTSW
jgi:hypothetical protein